MPKLIDLTGQKFNRWTVLERAENKGKAVYWKCQCECGTIKNVQGHHLRNGASKSCGCLQKEIAKNTLSQIGQNNFNDLSNKRFGFWTVIKDSGKRASNGSIIWHCKCDCGEEKDLESRYLLYNVSISCGCKARISKGEELISSLLTQAGIPFETQKTFEDCRFPNTGALAKFDFFVNGEYLIEYDGQQHFYTGGWADEEKVEKIQERDAFKDQWCKQHNIPLIRIPYIKYETLTIDDLLLNRKEQLDEVLY